jgi:hypothetical protein
MQFSRWKIGWPPDSAPKVSWPEVGYKPIELGIMPRNGL